MRQDPKETVRYTVHYSGRVQGVGFRFTAVQAAEGWCVAGVVENLANGQVRLIGEGPRGELDGLLKEIDRRMSGHITDKRVFNSAATGEFGDPTVGGLTIRY